MPVIAFRGKQPHLGEDAFIAPGAYVVGDVTLGARTSIWFNAVVRGDMDKIEIGAETNVQDNVTIHIDAGSPTHIGNRVTIGHNAVLHGCTVEDGVLVGMGAVILNRAVIGRDSLIAAGALVPPGTVIPPRSLVMGSPGKVVRTFTADQIPSSGGMHLRYMELIEHYR